MTSAPMNWRSKLAPAGTLDNGDIMRLAIIASRVSLGASIDVMLLSIAS